MGVVNFIHRSDGLRGCMDPNISTVAEVLAQNKLRNASQSDS